LYPKNRPVSNPELRPNPQRDHDVQNAGRYERGDLHCHSTQRLSTDKDEEAFLADEKTFDAVARSENGKRQSAWVDDEK